MLLRIYRLTDKTGLALLKISQVLGEMLFGGVSSVWGVLWRIITGIVRLLVVLIGLLITLLLAIISGIWAAIKAFGRFMLAILGVGKRAVLGIGRVGRGVARQTVVVARQSSETINEKAVGSVIARRTHAEVDVKIAEDPLKVQNRRLSALVVVLGVIVVGAVLWATDPSRGVGTPTVSGGDVNVLLRQETPQSLEETPVSVVVATPIPIATPLPASLRAGGTLAYTVREQGQTDIWLVGVSARTPIRITNDASDERDPSWSWDGTRLAYASRRTGNWEIFVYDLPTQTTLQVTYDLSFQSNPRWSPDNLWIVYESYQGNNLDLYAVPIDGSEVAIRLTEHPAPDFSPSWSPDGRKIAYVSLQDGNQDIFVYDLDTLERRNLTQTALLNEDSPSWSPDGRSLVYSAYDQGSEKVFVRSLTDDAPTVLSFGRTPSWSPDGANVVFAVDSNDGVQTYLYVVPVGREDAVATEVISVPYGAKDPSWSSQTIPPSLLNSGGLALNIPPLYVEQFDQNLTGAPFGLRSLLDVQAPRAVLSDKVNDSFNALRARVFATSGVDFLSNLDDAWWDLERRPNPGEERRSWHMTGRAVAIPKGSILGFPPPIEVVREDIGVNTYWRVYLRVEENSQLGQLGEPLRTFPWDFIVATSGDVEAFNNGGRLRAEVPTGYYVDLTQLAEDYGWGRLATGTNWQANVSVRNYWLLVKQESLDWLSAMREIYTDGELVNFLPRGS